MMDPTYDRLTHLSGALGCLLTCTPRSQFTHLCGGVVNRRSPLWRLARRRRNITIIPVSLHILSIIAEKYVNLAQLMRGGEQRCDPTPFLRDGLGQQV